MHMVDIPFGTLLWVAARPILRLFMCVAGGYGITRAGYFPAIATRGAVQIVLNVTLPSLIFSRASSALNAENDVALGPLFVIAIIYMAMGFLLSLFIKKFFWVPSQFRYGLIVAGCWASNCDITISVMTDIMASLPFDGTHDQDLAVAYIGAFCVIFYLTLFMFGRDLIEKDFTGTDVQGPCRDKRWEKRVSSSTDDEEAGKNYDLEASTMDAYVMSSKDLPPQLSSLQHSQTVSEASSTIVHHDMPSDRFDEMQSSKDAEIHITPASIPNSSANRSRPFMQFVKFLSSLLSPVLLSLIISIMVSRISALKALFIPGVSGTNIPLAPDGQPLLAFIMDAATFLGAANSPIGLIILGSALARISIPRGRWTSLPLGAIGALAVCKQLIMPVLGVLICKGFSQTGFIGVDDKVLKFLRIMFTHSVDPVGPDASTL
ncbi:auxin efflux carrier [Suillus clintonianus]|uniref:auxin efflux carrier n=1 Tax=Suillus clintonianus TaxID=1904413 RepID=UPI001B860656|nr:auxin efflux carrier [Suillus clintonianus]KAG2130706.1 auxin efflux carrier [Suillus clintonianus]